MLIRGDGRSAGAERREGAMGNAVDRGAFERAITGNVDRAAPRWARRPPCSAAVRRRAHSPQSCALRGSGVRICIEVRAGVHHHAELREQQRQRQHMHEPAAITSNQEASAGEYSRCSAVDKLNWSIHRVRNCYGRRRFDGVRRRSRTFPTWQPLMRVARHGGAAAAHQEVQVRALVGLLHVLDIKLVVAALRAARAPSRPRGASPARRRSRRDAAGAPAHRAR